MQHVTQLPKPWDIFRELSCEVLGLKRVQLLALLCACATRQAGGALPPMPEALLFNVAPIYENLKWMMLPEGGFVYPNGQDWELFRKQHSSQIHRGSASMC